MSTLTIPVSASDHLEGDLNAPVVLVEFGDYQCPDCGIAYPIVKRLQQHFGERLGFVFRNFPLTQIHAHAQSAAEAAEFAAAHGRFWEMHDGIFQNQAALDRGLLLELAAALKLPTEALERAFDTGEYAARVKSDFMGGVRSGVNGTPTFFINGQRHEGAYDFDTLVAAIDAQLRN